MSQIVDQDNILTNQMISDYGCKNCILKLNGKCPHNLDDDEILPEGYCTELTNLFKSLSNGNDTQTTIREKYQIYLQEMQSNSDLKEFKQLERKLKELDPRDPEYQDTQTKMHSYKMWWARLSEQTTKGLAKVNDRDQRRDTGIIELNKINLTQLHMIVRESDKALEFDKSKIIDVKGNE